MERRCQRKKEFASLVDSSSENPISESAGSHSQHQNPTSQQNRFVFESPRFYNMKLDYSYRLEDSTLESYFARMNLSTTGRFSHSSNEQQRSLNTMRSDDQYSLAAGHPSYQNSSQNGTTYMEQYPYFSNIRNNNGGCCYDQNVRDQDYHDRFALHSFPSTSQNGTGYTVRPSFSNIGNNNGGLGYNQNIQDRDCRDRFALHSFSNFGNKHGSTSRAPIRSQSYDALDQYRLCFGRILDADSTMLDTGSQFRSVRSLESAKADTLRVSSLPNSPVFLSDHPSLYKLKGIVAVAARSQSLYRILQGVLDERKPDLIEMVFLEVKDLVHDLMEDQFGNHVIQKLFEVCGEAQMTQLILSLIHNQRRLLGLCFHPVGTRAMQKMIEHIKTPEQRLLLAPVLIRRTVILSRNQNGYHVIQKCMEHFPFDDIKPLIKEIAESFLDIAMDKSGCCVLNRALYYAQGELKQRLLHETITNAMLLSESPFGNYVVQHVLNERIQNATIGILEHLKGCFVSLSMNKFGSNVVEKCLIWSGEENASMIIEEFMHSPYFVNVCRNNFGNYVVQKALEVSKGGIRNALVSRINDSYPDLYGDINAKRVVKKARDISYRI
ncbi:pumilio [Populus alba x Populus x berolinensis]|nr:pumilio [Populus alba x Populus x berolinensis]